jgi:hypothetical protein
MENREPVVKMEYGTKRPPKKRKTPGMYERQEEYRATVIDTECSIRENLERNWKNFIYY